MSGWIKPTVTGTKVALVGLILMFIVLGTATLSINIGVAIGMYWLSGLFALGLRMVLVAEKKGAGK